MTSLEESQEWVPNKSSLHFRQESWIHGEPTSADWLRKIYEAKQYLGKTTNITTENIRKRKNGALLVMKSIEKDLKKHKKNNKNNLWTDERKESFSKKSKIDSIFVARMNEAKRTLEKITYGHSFYSQRIEAGNVSEWKVNNIGFKDLLFSNLIMLKKSCEIIHRDSGQFLDESSKYSMFYSEPIVSIDLTTLKVPLLNLSDILIKGEIKVKSEISEIYNLEEVLNNLESKYKKPGYFDPDDLLSDCDYGTIANFPPEISSIINENIRQFHQSLENKRKLDNEFEDSTKSFCKTFRKLKIEYDVLRDVVSNPSSQDYFLFLTHCFKECAVKNHKSLVEAHKVAKGWNSNDLIGSYTSLSNKYKTILCNFDRMKELLACDICDDPLDDLIDYHFIGPIEDPNPVVHKYHITCASNYCGYYSETGFPCFVCQKQKFGN